MFHWTFSFQSYEELCVLYLYGVAIAGVAIAGYRALLAKLRGGTAPLEIERGRYVGLVPEDRLCKLCSVEVEDEPHFCIRCNALEEERQHLFQFMERITPGSFH